jgi:hypothetical protein
MKEDAKKEQIARNDAKVIEQACKKYYSENGKWPAQLTDVAKLLDNGEKGLTDPWGKKYQFSMAKMKSSDGQSIESACIWSERKVNGVTRVCGKRLSEDKK